LNRPLVLFGAVALLAAAHAAFAGDMPKSEYYQYIPLDYTRPIRQTQASADLNLYGDPSAPGYRDEDPVDGVDDRRHAALQDLGVRFAPYLVPNTTAVPMDWKKFMAGRSSWPLYIDTWNQAVEGGELVREEQIDWLALDGTGCPEAASPEDRAGTDDCRLLSLIEEFDPEDPTSGYYRHAAVDSRVDPFKVLYFNFPGSDEKTWREEYEDPVSGELPQKYWSFAKTYLHPFAEEVRDYEGKLTGYELVLQYWFFYSWNDGGNNHEGDWEHVNIIVAPKGSVTRPQTPEEMEFMLDGGGASPADGDRYVVIKRVDYYFHEKVWTLDYARPNVYLDRESWKKQFDAFPTERINQHYVWQHLRERAYEDAAETVINTHIVGFIGADNKGTDQILASPGGKNRDSHGTFPFLGLYKNVGPAGASEHINAPFHYHQYFAGDRPGLEDGRQGRGRVLRLDRPDRVEIVPDWERIHPLLYTDPVVRREWSWLVLPIRWGYPAAESPFAGVVSHASTGNLAPQTGSQNRGWNRSGAGSGFHDYSPHRYSDFFALGWVDRFQNNWGWLNATFPTLSILPPLDLALLAIRTPISFFKTNSSTFLQADNLPFRFLSLEAGAIIQDLPDDFTALLLNRDQVHEILDATGTTDIEGLIVTDQHVDQPTSFVGRASLYVGRRFASENAFWVTHAGMSVSLVGGDGEQHKVESELAMWEYAGSMRVNFSASTFQPYAKLGYGVTGYHLQDVRVNGAPIPTSESPSLHPFVWHYAVGLEWLPIASVAPPPRGMDIGLRIEFSQFRHDLQLDHITDPLLLALGQVSSSRGITRSAVQVALSVGL